MVRPISGLKWKWPFTGCKIAALKFPMKNLQARLLLYVKGIAMGAADIVPGVSGGTIAFVTGIYREFIDALQRLDHHALGMVLSGKFKSGWRYFNGPFLLVLASGIFTAVLSLANLLKYLLDTYPIFLWSFFFGLIIASAVVVRGKLERWRPGLLVFVALGSIVAYFVTSSAIVQTPDTLPYVYMAGVVSIMAMILPGVSGSFLLVVLNKYNYIIGALSSVGKALKASLKALTTDGAAAAWQALGGAEWMVLLLFYLGTMTGLIGFSKVLSWLFRRYHDPTIAILIGFMIGSLNKVWPWKETISTYTDRHGVEKPLLERNVVPDQWSSELGLAILLALCGFALVYGLELMARRFQQKSQDVSTSQNPVY